MNKRNINNNKLEDYRKEINEIDNKLIELLNERGSIVQKIGNVKLELRMETHQPKREKEIIERIKQKSTILKPMSIEAIWKEIISASKLIQGFVDKVGFLGPKGTFTHQAALEYFPKAGTEFITFTNNLEIFENIEKEIVDFGVIPIENSLQGTVRENLDLLIEKDLFIYGEIELRIIQNLISLNNSDISKIQNIISHPQAIAQTRNWLKNNLPKAKLINASSTAEAVRRVNELNDETYAAIGTKFSSKLYGLKVLNSRIEDDPSNYTRFLIISKKENEHKEGKIKTSIVFVTKNIPGTLYGVLKIFADANINLSKIESRPRRKGRWEYIFLMDFEGNKDDPIIKKAIEKMNENVIWYKILGSYPLIK
ncbi:MAG: prephenate dehydratase [Candidatus Odinarchaeota archaeon]